MIKAESAVKAAKCQAKHFLASDFLESDQCILLGKPWCVQASIVVFYAPLHTAKLSSALCNSCCTLHVIFVIGQLFDGTDHKLTTTASM